MTTDQESFQSDDEWVEWDPARLLRAYSPDEMRFSSGFLGLAIEEHFSLLKSHWLPLFHSLGTSVQLLSVQKSFEYPAQLRRQFVIEIGGETGLLGLDTRAERALAGAVVPQSDPLASEILLEYLERRLLSSLTKSWSGPGEIKCVHVNDGDPHKVKIAGAVHLSLSIDGIGSDVWFGLGPRTITRLDQIAREERTSTEGGEQIETFAVELAELLVPPELLIDYLRPETVIGLDLPVRADVIIRKNDEPWALGRLGQSQGKFVVEVIDFDPETAGDAAGNTKLLVEVCRTELTVSERLELTHRGAVLRTSRDVSPEVSLMIRNEKVGSALVGSIGGQFALNVLHPGQK